MIAQGPAYPTRTRLRSSPSDLLLTGSRRDPHVNDSLSIRVDPTPPRKGIEAADGALLRREKGPGDAVPGEQRGERGIVASFGCEVAVKKCIPVELGTAVDEGRDAAEGQIAAKTLAVQYGTLEPHPRHGGECLQRGHRIV